MYTTFIRAIKIQENMYCRLYSNVSNKMIILITFIRIGIHIFKLMKWTDPRHKNMRRRYTECHMSRHWPMTKGSCEYSQELAKKDTPET